MPLYKQDKKQLAQKIKEVSKNKPYTIIMKHKQLKFKDIDKTRRQANENTIICKIKNRIAKIIFKESPLDFINNLKNENIVIMSSDLFDAFKAASILANSTENIEISTSIGHDKIIDKDIIEKIAKFKSEEGLRSALLNVISEVYKKPLRIMLAKANQKEME